MILNRQSYKEQYIPTQESIKFYLWFSNLFNEPNKTPQVHFMLIDHLNNPKYKQKVIECFRGFGKTTLTRYSILYWLYLGSKPGFGEFNYILIVQKNVKMASSTIETLKYLIEDKLSDVLEIRKVTLNEEPTLVVFNKAKNKTMIVRGRGSGQSIRGINYLGKRPNIIIFDDIEDEKEHSTPESRTKLKEWFFNAVLPAVDKSNYEYIFIGTPIHEDSLLMNLVNSSNWYALVLPVCENFNPNNPEEITPAWSDRFPIEEIINDYKNSIEILGSPKGFYQEYLLEVTPADSLLYDLEKIRKYNYENLLYGASNYTYYISVDIATSDKQTADYSSVAVIGIDARQNWFLVDGFYGRVLPLVLINKILEMAYKWNVQEIILEDIGLGKMLENYISNEMIRRGRFFNIDKVRRNRISKIQIFKGFEPIVNKGKFFIPEKTENEDFEKFIKELLHEMGHITYDAILAKHDDVLDSIAQLAQKELMYIEPIYENQQEEVEYKYSNSYSF
jgi:hypothetical protein